MGIKGGKSQLGILRNARKNHLEELSERLLGADINLWLYQLVTQDREKMAKLHQKLTERWEILRDMGIALIFVFDGCRNPRK